MVLTAAVCLFTAGWRVPSGDYALFWNGLAAFGVLGFLSEASYLRLRVGSAETQSSVAFIPFIAAVLLFDTGWASLVAAGAVLAVEYVVKKKTLIKVVFNASQMTVSVALASFVYQSLGGEVSLTHFALRPLPIAGAVLTYFFINSTAVSFAVALGDGIPLSDGWRRCY